MFELATDYLLRSKPCGKTDLAPSGQNADAATNLGVATNNGVELAFLRLCNEL